MVSEKYLNLCKRIKEEGLKKIDQKIVYVLFNFGGTAYVGVNIYEGLTLDECVFLRSEDIEEYLNEDKKWVTLKI